MRNLGGTLDPGDLMTEALSMTTTQTSECLVHQSEFGRCGGYGKSDTKGMARGTFLPAGVASTTNRYARTETHTFRLTDLRRCECGCAGSFVVAP